MLLIGLDAASQLERFGYAIGRWNEDIVEIEEAGLVASAQCADAIAARIAPRVREADGALIAIAAPLGWPEALGRAVAGHRGRLSGKELPLAWRHDFTGATTIEVYPACPSAGRIYSAAECPAHGPSKV